MNAIEKLWRSFWRKKNTNKIDETWIDHIRVSTVHLYGINHNLSGEGPPLFYETMVFGGALDGEQRRYSTVDEAREGHGQVVLEVAEAL